MKIITVFLSIFFFVSCADAKEKTYIGSTPAGRAIKSFLEIPLPDSIDFIRWKTDLMIIIINFPATMASARQTGIALPRAAQKLNYVASAEKKKIITNSVMELTP